MLLALGISGDLRAHNPSRVTLGRGAADPADAPAVDALDFERAGARAIVRANAGDDVERQLRAPPVQSGTDYHKQFVGWVELSDTQQRERGGRHDLWFDTGATGDPRRGVAAVRAVWRRILAEERRGGRVSARIPCGDGRRGLARYCD